MTVTADGAAYYERAVRILADMDELDGSMTLLRTTPKGRLRIDVSASIAMLCVIPSLPEFHARYPDIQVEIGVTDRVVDLIGENIDCVIRAGTIADQSLVARRIGEMRFITSAAPSYLATARRAAASARPAGRSPRRRLLQRLVAAHPSDELQPRRRAASRSPGATSRR